MSETELIGTLDLTLRVPGGATEDRIVALGGDPVVLIRVRLNDDTTAMSFEADATGFIDAADLADFLHTIADALEHGALDPADG